MDDTYCTIPEPPNRLRKVVAGAICVASLSLALIISVKGGKAIDEKASKVDQVYSVSEPEKRHKVDPRAGYQLVNTSWDQNEPVPELPDSRDWNALEVNELPELGNLEFGVVDR